VRKKIKTKPMALKDKQNRTIVLSITEVEYDSFMADNKVAHKMIREAYAKYPELFPPEMSWGYKLNGKTRKSKKMDLRMRRIEIQGITYRLRPSFVLPYMRATVDQVRAPLFLVRFGVPFWALALIFGRNAMFWYRTFLLLGRFSIVGTTIHRPDHLPEDLLADEFHIRVKGQKAYVATTIAKSCMLGVETCAKADADSLRSGYQVFKEEATRFQPDYQPRTVNTDGWYATQNESPALVVPSLCIKAFWLNWEISF
jgi:hypothetical protein